MSKIAKQKWEPLSTIMDRISGQLPPNTLTNADGMPYAARHDSAIDQQKLQAHRYARLYAQLLYAGFFQTEYAHLNGSWNQAERDQFEQYLMKHLEPCALAMLKDVVG